MGIEAVRRCLDVEPDQRRAHLEVQKSAAVNSREGRARGGGRVGWRRRAPIWSASQLPRRGRDCSVTRTMAEPQAAEETQMPKLPLPLHEVRELQQQRHDELNRQANDAPESSTGKRKDRADDVSYTARLTRIQHDKGTGDRHPLRDGMSKVCTLAMLRQTRGRQ